MRFIKQYSKQFKKQWLINVLSISGLSIGLSITLLMGWWGLNEFSFDRFFKDGDRVYRVCREGFINNETVKIASCFAPVARESKAHFPEIEESMKVIIRWEEEVIKDEKTTFETFLFADSNFLQILDYPLVEGDASACLKTPHSILISQSMAHRLFGKKEGIVGQTLLFREEIKTVSGILKDVPPNSHLYFSAVVRMQDYPYHDNNEWMRNDEYITYLKLHEGANVEELAGKITALSHEQAPVLKTVPIKHFIQPLHDIHFGSSDFRFDSAITGNLNLVLVLMLMAFIILIIACINFTNLYISTAFLRAKSLAVKKTNGASRWHIIRDFYTETSFSVFIATILGILLATAVLPVFNEMSNSNIEFVFSNINLYTLLLGIAVFTIILSGTVPAVSMARMNLIQSLKGEIKGTAVSFFQKALITIQFAASIILLIVVFGIQKQIYYLKNADLGFDVEKVIYVRANEGFSKNYNAIKQELERHTSVKEVTCKNSLPLNWNNGNAVSVPGQGSEPYIMEICYIKSNYFQMMDIEVVAGEQVEERHEGKNYVWLNEQAAEVLGLDDAVGKQIELNDELYEIKGIAENIKSKSLHINVDPQVYRPDSGIYNYYQILIRYNGEPEAAIGEIEKLWKQYNADEEFEYSFLDQAYDNLYHAEERAGKIVAWGMFIAIFLTLVGTFAMATYAAERRTKEIGIRKVNGARTDEILLLLNKDFMKFIGIAFVIAVPLAYYLMNSWLENFAFRTPLSWWIFVLGGLIVLAISLITISWRSFRAARRNPVEALRYE